jgi:hypothetical protein
MFLPELILQTSISNAPNADPSQNSVSVPISKSTVVL